MLVIRHASFPKLREERTALVPVDFACWSTPNFYTFAPALTCFWTWPVAVASGYHGLSETRDLIDLDAAEVTVVLSSGTADELCA